MSLIFSVLRLIYFFAKNIKNLSLAIAIQKLFCYNVYIERRNNPSEVKRMQKLSVLEELIKESIKLERAKQKNYLISFRLLANMHDDAPVLDINLTFEPNTKEDFEKLNAIVDRLIKRNEIYPLADFLHKRIYFNHITRKLKNPINLTFSAKINNDSITGTYQECCKWLVENMTDEQFFKLIR